ncbi:MAG: hypothetical protein BWX77_00578 [Bacteroidetes bacterium ADurb.Bin090]|nr:MAG: hypothetical protein BWX77_00578 [Bacteroidetes bacterium ADurb.Bin090]
MQLEIIDLEPPGTTQFFESGGVANSRSATVGSNTDHQRIGFFQRQHYRQGLQWTGSATFRRVAGIGIFFARHCIERKRAKILGLVTDGSISGEQTLSGHSIDRHCHVTTQEIGSGRKIFILFAILRNRPNYPKYPEYRFRFWWRRLRCCCR